KILQNKGISPSGTFLFYTAGEVQYNSSDKSFSRTITDYVTDLKTNQKINIPSDYSCDAWIKDKDLLSCKDKQDSSVLYDPKNNTFSQDNRKFPPVAPLKE